MALQETSGKVAGGFRRVSMRIRRNLVMIFDDCAAGPGYRQGPVLRPAGPVVRVPETGVQSRNILARLQGALWRFQRALGRLQKVLEGF